MSMDKKKLYDSAENGDEKDKTKLLDDHVDASTEYIGKDNNIPLTVASDKLMTEGDNIKAKDKSLDEQLYDAAERGDVEAVNRLLDEGAGTEYRDLAENTPLLIAIFNGRLEVVDKLLDKGANIEAKNEVGDTPLLIASRNGYSELVDKLLDKGANIEAANKDNNIPLTVASDKLMTEGDNIKAKDKSLDEQLYDAAERGDVEAVNRLLDEGAGTEYRDLFGTTPLLIAIIYHHSEVVDKLLDKGANIEAANKDGTTPLMIAIIYNHSDVVDKLLDKGANIEAANKDGNTPLMIAIRNGRSKVVDKLLDKEANIEATNKNGNTPLLIAFYKDNQLVVDKLLDKGANIEAANNFGDTPLISASRYRRSEVVDKLLDKGANIEATNKDGDTPLIIAIRNGRSEVVDKLLDKGANIEAKNKVGDTPRIIASRNGYSLMKRANIEAKNNSDSLMTKEVNKQATYMSDKLITKEVNIVPPVHPQIPRSQIPTPPNDLRSLGESNSLTTKKVNIKAKDESLEEKLYDAASRGDVKAVERLLIEGANIECCFGYRFRDTPLIWAIRNGSRLVVYKLLDKGANIEAANEDGDTPLIIAIRNGHLEMVNKLLDKGANIEAKNKVGDTPRIIASRNGYSLVKGANIEAKNNEEKTAISLALENKQPRHNNSKLYVTVENGDGKDRKKLLDDHVDAGTEYRGKNNPPLNEGFSSWYVPFISEKAENIVIQPNDSLTTQDDIETKFNEIVEHLKADYPEVDYRLLYFPDTLLPCCYIHSKREQLKVIQEVINNFRASLFFTVIIDSQCGGYCGYNPEFESLSSDIWDSMSIEGLTLDTLNEAIQKLNIQSSSEVNVMFGPTYDYNIKQWSSRASIWVGYTDSIMRHFLLARDESRVEVCDINSRAFPVQYWSMTSHLLTRYSDTTKTSRRGWEEKIGIRCKLPEDLNGPHSRGGSLGPSIKSMFPDWDVPNTWFLTAAHNFEHPEIKFDYSFALQHPEVLNYVDDHVGNLIGINKEQQLAVVKINSCNINYLNIKVTHNSYIPCIRGLGIDDLDIVTWKRDIYKSGATTGLTTGTLSSWGIKVNPNYDNNPGAKSPFIIVRKERNKFSEYGDSGGSVFYINGNNEATILGIVEAYWRPHLQWEFCAVTPFFPKELKEWIMELNDTIVYNDNTSLDSEFDDLEPSDGKKLTNGGCCMN